MAYGVRRIEQFLKLIERFSIDISAKEKFSYDTIDDIAQKAVQKEPFSKLSRDQKWALEIYAREYLVTLLQEEECRTEAEKQWNTFDKRMRRGGLSMLLTGTLAGLYSCSEGSPPPQYLTIGTILGGIGGTLYVILYEDRVPKTRMLQDIAYRFTPAWKKIAKIRKHREFRREISLINLKREESLEEVATKYVA